MPPSTVTTTKTKTRTPWQRLFASLVGIGIVLLDWRWAVNHLYSLPEHSISAFVSITNNAHYVIGSIVIFMITGKLIFDWKNQTASQVVEQTQHIFEQVVERTPKAEHFDGPDIP